MTVESKCIFTSVLLAVSVLTWMIFGRKNIMKIESPKGAEQDQDIARARAQWHGNHQPVTLAELLSLELRLEAITLRRLDEMERHLIQAMGEAVDPAKLKAATDTLKGSSESLAASVKANQP